jgi:hypothetical protein
MDAIVGFWIPLRKYHALSTALRTATPVGVLTMFSVKALNRAFGNDGLLSLVRARLDAV